MKNGLKKTIAQLGVAAAIAVPMSATVNLVGANAAEALTVSSYNSSRCVGTSLWAVTSTFYDYNWYEETFQGKRDYWTTYYKYRIAYNHPACVGPIVPI